MLWFFFALGCAFSEFVKDLTSKKAFRNIDEYVSAFATAFFSLPWLAAWMLFAGIGEVAPMAFVYAPLAAGMHVAALVLYFRAIRSGDLSIVLPLLSFTPFFYLFTSPVMIGEYPNLIGILGVLFIVVGSYLLNLNARKTGLLQPFRLLVKSTAARSMLGTAVIWSITGNIDRMGLRHCELSTWVFLLVSLMSAGFFIVMRLKSKVPLRQAWQSRKALLTLGFFHASSSILYMQAITLTLVAYVVSVKRLSVVLGVLWGGFVLKEEDIVQRLIATTCMLIGVLLISLS